VVSIKQPGDLVKRLALPPTLLMSALWLAE